MHRGWMKCYHKSYTRKKERKLRGKKKERKKKKWSNLRAIYGDCKLGASWNGQDFTKHTSWLQEF